jgi:hypothetical protein
MGILAVVVDNPMFPMAVMGIYVLTAMLGLVAALIGGAASEYFKTPFLVLGLFLFLLGVLGAVCVWRKWWFKLLCVNIVNFLTTIALIIFSILAIFIAFDITDPVTSGVQETWAGSGNLHAALNQKNYCENHVTTKSDLERHGMHALTEGSACKNFYKWANMATDTREEEGPTIETPRCEFLKGLKNSHGFPDRCPPLACPYSVGEMAIDCSKILQEYTVDAAIDEKSICDTSSGATSQSVHDVSLSERTWYKECLECGKGCQMEIIEEYQDSLKILPWVCYLFAFSVVVILMYNVYLIDVKDDIDTWYAYMDMEADTRGVGKIFGDRPEFEGTGTQKMGMILNLVISGLGVTQMVLGCLVFFMANKFFRSICLVLFAGGLFFAVLGFLMYWAIKANKIAIVQIGNALLFFMCFISLLTGIFIAMSTGNVSNFRAKIDEDFVELREEAEMVDPKYCMDRPGDGREIPMGEDACKQKIFDDAQSNIAVIAWLGGTLTLLMIILMYCTHNLVYDFYRDPVGEPDTSIKEKIEKGTGHAKRLPHEELTILKRWKLAKRSSSGGVDKVVVKKARSKTLVRPRQPHTPLYHINRMCCRSLGQGNY